jgi:hypothetical protein
MINAPIEYGKFGKNFYANFILELKATNNSTCTDFYDMYRNGGCFFTHEIKRIIEVALKKTYSAVGCNENEHYIFCRELFRVDVTTYIPSSYHRTEKRKEEAKALDLYDSCWCLDIAVEHENMRSWLDEFYKLNCSFCNLKILVAYQLKEDQSSALEFAIRGFDCMGDANKEQFKSSNYLVLFGKRNCELDGGFGDITKLYQAYYKPANSYEFTQL